ncbi:MAG: RnfABCDGE type electron transport complex subunit D [Thermodesulfobacteriota bacterium]|nr:RnfABCDGE type electron transport complex subunit D [Thermodesulfobacteriota bacterium]
MANEDAKSLSILSVGASPHWHCGRTVPGYMQSTVLALLPAAAMAVVIFGIQALQVMALSCATAVIVEAVCCKCMEREPSVDDFSALLIGLLFAFLLPAAAPWWLVVAGSAISILLGKMLFGGLGANPMCAPLVGWAVCRLSWVNFIDIDATMLNTELINPITQLKYYGPEAAAQVGMMDILLGNQLGGLGSVHVLAIALGGVYLIATRKISFHIPLAFLIGVFVTASIFYLIDSNIYIGPVFHILGGSVMLGAFFLATDPGSSPVEKIPMIIYGLAAGALVIIIRVYGIYPDGVPFAILLANLMMPLLDRIRPKPFGAR